MFGKTEEKTVQPVKTKKKLSRADKKQIEAAIARANRTDKKGKSAQDSICLLYTSSEQRSQIHFHQPRFQIGHN